MNSIYLNIAEILNSPSAITRGQGEIVYDKIVENLEAGNKVVLDFSDIEGLISAFLNVAIGKLYEKYSSDVLNNQLVIKGTTAEQNRIFKVVIQNAKQYYKDKEVFDSVVKGICE